MPVKWGKRWEKLCVLGLPHCSAVFLLSLRGIRSSSLGSEAVIGVRETQNYAWNWEIITQQLRAACLLVFAHFRLFCLRHNHWTRRFATANVLISNAASSSSQLMRNRPTSLWLATRGLPVEEGRKGWLAGRCYFHADLFMADLAVEQQCDRSINICCRKILVPSRRLVHLAPSRCEYSWGLSETCLGRGSTVEFRLMSNNSFCNFDASFKSSSKLFPPVHLNLSILPLYIERCLCCSLHNQQIVSSCRYTQHWWIQIAHSRWLRLHIESAIQGRWVTANALLTCICLLG